MYHPIIILYIAYFHAIMKYGIFWGKSTVNKTSLSVSKENNRNYGWIWI